MKPSRLAKEYSTENSPSFVNGVLDAVLREKTNAPQPIPNEPNPT